MLESFQSLRSGVRLYDATFQGELADHWQDKFASSEGQTLIQELRSERMNLRYGYRAVSGEDGSSKSRLTLHVGRLDRPVTENDRAILRDAFPTKKVLFWGRFPENIEPLGTDWNVIYSSPGIPEQQNAVPQISPFDQKLPKDHFDIAVQAASINKLAALLGGGEIGEEAVRERIKFADSLWGMRASGFFRVIDCDTWDLSNPLIEGEYENLEEAQDLVQRQLKEERSVYESIPEMMDKVQAGLPITSSILYIYGPNGEVRGRYPI